MNNMKTSAVSVKNVLVVMLFLAASIYANIGAAMISCGNSYSGTQNLTIGMNEWGASLCYGKFVMPIMSSYKCLQSFRVPLTPYGKQVFSPVEVDEQVGLDVDIMCEDE